MSGRKRAGDKWDDASRRLAKLFRDQRKAQGLSQESVARAADLALLTVRKIETNRIREPGVFTVLAMVQALGLSAADLQQVVEEGRRDD